MLSMPHRMMAILLLFVAFGSGCRGTEKKEEPSQIPPEESAEELVVPELAVPEPTPVVEEPATTSEASPSPEVVVEPTAPVEPDDPETSAIRTRIAELSERRDALRKRKEEAFTRIPEKNNRRLARMRREFAEAFDALQSASIAKEEDR